MKKQESQYNIWVDNILYNSFSDKYISFQKNEVEDIQYYLNHLENLEADYPDIFDDFVKLGFVKDEDFDELDYIFFENKNVTLCNKNYHLTINPTLQCNYRCWYCCVEDSHTLYENRRMDDVTIDKVKKHIQYMIEQEHITELYLDWFGGEPLMYFYQVVYPISLFAIKLCEKHNLPFRNHVTTNAYFIDEQMIDAFNEIHLYTFQIPIDGNKQKHNQVKNHEGEGHYDQILETINNICEKISDSQIVMRVNYDKQTLRGVSSVINDIKKKNREKIFVDYQRIWQVDITRDNDGNNQPLIKIKKEFEAAGFRSMYHAYRRKNYTCCYSDSFYHRVINYDGKVFKCTARDYNDDLCIATLQDNGSMNLRKNLLSRMFSGVTFDNEKCRSCKQLPLCFGPCIQSHFEIKMGKASFVCSQDVSEISFDEYIKEKVNNDLTRFFNESISN
jgi:uncharacterized protein